MEKNNSKVKFPDVGDDLDLRPPVVFNFGGIKQKVDWSLLDQYPGSLLTTTAKLANDEEVMLERGGASFPTVVKYMQDNKADVWLPPHVSSAQFLKDMNYFGIDIEPGCVHSGAENVSWAQQAMAFRNWNASFKQFLQAKRKLVDLELECADLAANCITTFGNSMSASWPQQLRVSSSNIVNALQQPDDSSEMNAVRETLEKYGLLLVQQEDGRYVRYNDRGGVRYTEMSVQPVTYDA